MRSPTKDTSTNGLSSNAVLILLNALDAATADAELITAWQGPKRVRQPRFQVCIPEPQATPDVSLTNAYHWPDF